MKSNTPATRLQGSKDMNSLLGDAMVSENNPPALENDSIALADYEAGLNNVFVLANDKDPDGDQLHLISASIVNGEWMVDVVVNDDGSLGVTYYGNLSLYEGQRAEIDVSYTVSDGLLESTATLTVNIFGSLFVELDPFVGTGKADSMKGSSGRDRMTGLGGNDVLMGRGGNDNIKGGVGKDQIDGGNGDDWMDGGTAKDLLTGGNGADQFLFEDGGGRDIITDFKPKGGDIINLYLESITSFSDLKRNHMTQHGDHVWINGEDGDRITIWNVDVEDLKRSEIEVFTSW